MNDQLNSKPLSNEDSEKLFKLGLAVAEYEHKQLADDWKLVDAKAQACTAIAGVLLAALMVFVKDVGTSSPSWQHKVLLLCLLVCLAVAILSALKCMLRREVEDPLTADGARAMIDDAFGKPDAERAWRMQSDVLRSWSIANNDVRKKIVNDKAEWLFRAQASLVAATILAGLQIVAAVLSV
jgi:hypothetical protein